MQENAWKQQETIRQNMCADFLSVSEVNAQVQQFAPEPEQILIEFELRQADRIFTDWLAAINDQYANSLLETDVIGELPCAAACHLRIHVHKHSNDLTIQHMCYAYTHVCVAQCICTMQYICVCSTTHMSNAYTQCIYAMHIRNAYTYMCV